MLDTHDDDGRDQTSLDEKNYQRQKYDDIIQILLSAGYFRARINTLSEFDKVVGGLCWCITSSGEDVDVDILFQENSTIGQRITLSEAIVKALRKMNCPSSLQPHQIQGGINGADYPSIHPVIIWLVKKFFERRDIRESQLRAFSTLQFSKNYTLPSEIGINTDNRSVNLTKILKLNKSVRQYRRKVTRNESEITRVHSCLLEYGESFLVGKGNTTTDTTTGTAEQIRISVDDSAELLLKAGASGNSNDMSGFEKKLAQMAKDALKEEKAFAEHASKEEEELMKQMSQLQSNDTNALSGAHVGSLVGIGSSEIGSASAAYQAEVEEARRLMDSTLSNGKVGQAAVYKRQKQNILQMKQDVEAKALEVNSVVATMLEKLRIAEHERDGAIEYNGQLNGVIAKLTELEGQSSKQDELATLKHLVMLNETLKAQEQSFKAACKAQMNDFTTRIKALEEEDSSDSNSSDSRKLQEIEDMHAKIMFKYNRLRQILAETNLEISNSARIIDDVPTRTELIQYERRFTELYQQVAWKLDETRKYYDLYNTLDTTLNFLQKEVKLLNSISDSFNDAMTNAATKAEYLKQFDAVVRGVEESLVRQEGILTGKTTKVEELKKQHQDLVDEQRRYFNTVKSFQDECNKNEWLSSKLEQLQKQ